MTSIPSPFCFVLVMELGHRLVLSPGRISHVHADFPEAASSAVLAQGSVRFVDGSQSVFSVASFPACPPELLAPGFWVSLKGEGYTLRFFCVDCGPLALSLGFLPSTAFLLDCLFFPHPNPNLIIETVKLAYTGIGTYAARANISGGFRSPHLCPLLIG